MTISRPGTFAPDRFSPERTALPELSEPGDATPTDVVVGLVQHTDELRLVGADETTCAIIGSSAADILALAAASGANHEPGSVTIVRPHDVAVACVGLGENIDLTPGELRVGAGAGVRAIAAVENGHDHDILVCLDPPSAGHVQAVAEGALLASDRFAKLSGKETRLGVSRIAVASAIDGTADALERARVISRAVCVARDLTNLPPNLLYPESFVAQMKGFCSKLKLEIEVLDEKALAKGGYGGILAVGGGSARPPRLMRVDYHPAEAMHHLVFVGKGITYDSGGYNLKKAESLATMNQDMAGAAAAVAAVQAIATLGLNVHVTAYAPLAEQMISDRAYRPSDVMTMLDGTTVENLNSDCEGRIVLADGLVRASREEPDMIVDVATLTGACMVALGTQVAGVMTSDDETAERLLDAADAVDESFWQLPITDEVRDALGSPVADLRSKGDREGGALFAAAFLQQFVAPETAWAHLDIAGPAWNARAAHDYVPAHATGFGLRTLVSLASHVAA